MDTAAFWLHRPAGRTYLRGTPRSPLGRVNLEFRFHDGYRGGTPMEVKWRVEIGLVPQSGSNVGLAGTI